MENIDIVRFNRKMRRERIAIKTESLTGIDLSEKLPEFRLPGMDEKLAIRDK